MGASLKQGSGRSRLVSGPSEMINRAADYQKVGVEPLGEIDTA